MYNKLDKCILATNIVISSNNTAYYIDNQLQYIDVYTVQY
jgi:recombinational DNA repair protein RecR